MKNQKNACKILAIMSYFAGFLHILTNEFSRTIPGLFQDFKPNFHDQTEFRKFSVLRAYAGLYFERLSLKNILIISNSMNSHFYDLIFFQAWK